MEKMSERDLIFEFTNMQPDARLRELMLYVAQKCSDDPSFGATKLNKILYFSDFVSYLNDGQPVTGAEYMAQQHGPVPRRLIPVRQELEQSGDAVVEKRTRLAHEQHRLVPMRDPDLSLFTAREIAIVDEIIDRLRGRPAWQVSLLSHGIAWNIADEGESIPYQAAFLSSDPLSPEDIARAQELINEYGWAV
jgi:uncharacterized phage-associated protein